MYENIDRRRGERVRICRVCKGIVDAAGLCRRCGKVRHGYEVIEPENIETILYALYVDYVRRFHEQDAATMLDYCTFIKEMYGNRTFMESLLSMYGLQHRLKDYLISMN
jgi:hypothetical protein